MSGHEDCDPRDCAYALHDVASPLREINKTPGPMYWGFTVISIVFAFEVGFRSDWSDRPEKREF